MPLLTEVRKTRNSGYERLNVFLEITMAGSPDSVTSGPIKTLELPAALFEQLQREVKRSHTSITGLMASWIEDRTAADRAERASKGKLNVKADDLFRECGI